MNFENIINKFIDYLEKELKELSSVTYKRKIYVFYEYVTIKLQAKDVNFQSILTAMLVSYLTIFQKQHLLQIASHLTLCPSLH